MQPPLDFDPAAKPNPAMPVGLRSNHLSFAEAIAQSVATVTPTAAPAFIIPLMLGGSGNGTWLVFVIATLGIACMGREIAFFARQRSSAGSLYTFVAISLPSASLPVAWALLFAYLGTGIACVCGVAVYAHTLLRPAATLTLPEALWLSAVSTLLATTLAWRDVRFSTRLMLGLEAFSIAAILLLFVLPGHDSAVHVDRAQLLLSGVTLHQVQGGLVLGIFTFVGFESAASLGAEAINPLRTIPRAIWVTIVLCGLWFMVSAYAETIGFGGQASGGSEAPLKILANLRGYPAMGPILVVTSLISAFAGLVGCIQAGSRTLFRMGRDGQCAGVLGRAHRKHQSPHIAILASALVVAVVPAVLLLRGGHVPEIFNWVATFATFGFLTAYGLVALASGRARLRARRFGPVSVVSSGTIAGVLFLCISSSFDPSLTGVERMLPGIYVATLAISVAATYVLRKGVRTPASEF